MLYLLLLSHLRVYCDSETEEDERRVTVMKFKEKLRDLHYLPADPELLRWIDATNVSPIELSQGRNHHSIHLKTN